MARVALILMLEVGSVSGASLYVSTRDRGTRRRAGLLVAIATGVAATGGVQAYGFLVGLAVAAVLLLMVEVVSRYWHETAGPAAGTLPVQEPPEQTPSVHVEAERPALVALAATGTGDAPGTAAPVSTGGRPPKVPDAEVLAALAAQLADPEVKDPTADGVVEEFGMGKTRATRLLREARNR